MLRLWTVCALVLLASACEVAVGSGDLSTETREVGTFDGLKLTSMVDATVRLSEDDYGVQLVCDDNLLQYINTSVRGDVLVVEVINGTLMDPTGECQALVTAPTLASYEIDGSGSISTQGAAGGVEEISSSSSGTITVDDIDTTTLTIDQTGSGTIEVSGIARQIDIFQSSSGRIDASALVAEDAVVQQTGSGNIEVHATESIEVRLTGSGLVHVYGNPGNQNVTDNGSGDVTWEVPD